MLTFTVAGKYVRPGQLAAQMTMKDEGKYAEFVEEMMAETTKGYREPDEPCSDELCVYCGEPANHDSMFSFGGVCDDCAMDGYPTRCCEIEYDISWLLDHHGISYDSRAIYF